MADRLNGASGAGRRAREEVLAGTGIAFILAVTIAWWALALWPVDGRGADWLARTRLVCFGVEGNGLPDASGWINLIGQPLGMLAVLLVGWGRGVRALRARLRGSARLRAAAGAAAAVTLVGAGLAGWRVAGVAGPADWRVAGAAGPVPLEAAQATAHPRLDVAAPPLALLDQAGRLRTLEDFRGRPVLLTFAYAHCRTVCPVLVRDVLAARARLRERGMGRVPAVLVVTLDPWRDTPSRLPHIARSWALREDAYVLSGAVERVSHVLDAWNVPRRRDERTGELAHPALVYVLDGAGRIAFAATGGGDRLAALVERL